MAKKNSTKTATKEAMQASEPRLQSITGWKGINLNEAPANWQHEGNKDAQTDLEPNYLLVQNNVVSTDLGGLETRPKDSTLFECDGSGAELTGVSYLKGKWLYLVERSDFDGTYSIIAHDITSSNKRSIKNIWLHYNYNIDGMVASETLLQLDCEFTHIYSYLNDGKEYLLVLGKMTGRDQEGKCVTFIGDLDTIFDRNGGLANAARIDEPKVRPSMVAHNIIPNEAALDIWDTFIHWGHWITTADDQHTFECYDFGAYEYGGAIDSYAIQNRPATDKTIIKPMKWYVDEAGSLYMQSYGLGTIQKFDYSSLNLVWPSSGDSYMQAYWKKAIYADGIKFDRCWTYAHYNDVSVAPSGTPVNQWVSETANRYLASPSESLSMTKWAIYDGSFTNAPNPDQDYQTVFRNLEAGFDTNYVRYLIGSDTGDVWVLINQVRGATGNDFTLLQANAPQISETLIGSGVSNINILYAYANKFGQTSLTTDDKILNFSPNIGPVNWTLDQYVTLGFYNLPKRQGIERINIYCTMDESTSPIFIGSIEVDPDNMQDYYTYNWYGSMSDTDEWSDANMKPDAENTTMGPDARYCHMHDGRLYFWGSTEKPYRLTIGGNPGHELSSSRGLGGAFIDIEPGIGTVVHGTYKWKTTSGASIVTILCGNENTSTHKRFNLVENNITVDNELSEKSYMVEEISNTVGCQSDWGAGVWADGLYVLNRYGLTLTTMAMEYNSQIQSQVISDNVQPIFTDKLATLMDNARMIYADSVVYIVFGTENDPETLDRLILCYDIKLKAWYTFTYSDNDVDIRHLMNIDYKGAWEGLGLICPDHVGFIPTTGSQDYIQENLVPFLIETGELSTTRPTQQTSYIAQIEFRFDYFIGDMDVDLEGVDYYGRRVHVHRHIHTDEVVNDFVDWMRVNCILENYNITMKGQARFRLTHFISKIYIESRKVGLTRGYDALETYKNRRGGTNKIHHYIKNYANLRETILT